MFINLIKKIRRQPKHTRDKIALTVSGVFTLVVFSFWVFNLPARNLAILEDRTASSSSIFGDLFNEIDSQVSDLKESIETVSTSTDNTLLQLNPDNEVFNLATTTFETEVASTSSSTIESSATSSVPKSENSTPREVRIMPISSSTATTSSTTTAF